MKLRSAYGYLLLLSILFVCVSIPDASVWAKEADGPVAVFFPVNHATGVPLKGEISLTFKKKMKLANGEAITSQKANAMVTLLDERTAKQVETEVSWSPVKRKLTVKPKQPLSYQTGYVIKLLPGKVKDAENNLNRAEEAGFTTELREPGFAITSIPADLSKEIATNSRIVLGFNKRILLPSGKPVAKSTWTKIMKITHEQQKKVKFEAVWDENNQRVILNPEGNLQDGIRYTVMLMENTILDRQGAKNPQFTFTFTTAKHRDRIPPTVTVTPAHGAKGVGLDAIVTLQFGEEVTKTNGSELSNKEVTGLAIWKDENGTVVPHTATWNKRTRTITLRVKGKLKRYTTYTVSFPGNLVMDEAGNTNQAVQATFSTGGK